MMTNQHSMVIKIILGIAGVCILITCGVVAAGILYRSLRTSFEPKIQIVLEPDLPQAISVDPSKLEAAVQLLTVRCRLLGYSDVSFEIAENNQIIARVPDTTDIETFITRTTAVGLLELVDFGETDVSPGTVIATDLDYEYFPAVEGREWHTVMTNSHFKSAEVAEGTLGAHQVSFTLTPEGTEILSDYTTGHVGDYLGIVLDKVVLSVPHVNSPITEGEGVIAGDFTPEEAEDLAVYLSTPGPLPVPLKVKEILLNDQ